jgi:hypothetical protein
MPTDQVGRLGWGSFTLQRMRPVAAVASRAPHADGRPDDVWAEESYLRFTTGGGFGDEGERWPAVVVSNTAGDRVFRVRSATIAYGADDASARWLADGSGFVAMVAHSADPLPGAGYGQFGFAVCAADGGRLAALGIPPAEAAHDWYDGLPYRAPIPSPDDADVFALGPIELFNRRTGMRWRAGVQQKGVVQRVEPWLSGTSRILTFTLERGGHGLAGPPVLIPPLTEQAPFQDAPLQVQVASYTNGPSLAGEPGGEPIQTLGARAVLPLAEAIPGGAGRTGAVLPGSTWVRALLPSGQDGWLDARYLVWA